jgi:two-component system sensor histidine kinase/response regulator
MDMHRVLLAEDNRLNQIVAAGTLKKLGYEVTIVDGGIAAVEACRLESFDVVVMDVMMPDLDGYGATAQIRALEADRGKGHTPIIGLSARAMDGDREIAIAAGFSDYLTKPLREVELRDALHRWIGAPVLLRQ